MRGIRHKALLSAHRITQALEQLIDTGNQHTRLAWQSALGHGREVVLAAGLDLRGQVGQRLQAVIHTDPSEQQRDGQQGDLRSGHGDEDFPRQGRAFVECLRHGNQYRIFRPARRDQCRHEAYLLAMHHVEGEPQAADDLRRHIEKVPVTADEPLALGGDFEVGLVDFVELENLERDVRHVELYEPVLGTHGLRQRARRIDEPPIVDEVREVQRREIGRHPVERQQQHQHDAKP